MWEEPWIYNQENSPHTDRELISSLLRDGFISHLVPQMLMNEHTIRAIFQIKTVAHAMLRFFLQPVAYNLSFKSKP